MVTSRDLSRVVHTHLSNERDQLRGLERRQSGDIKDLSTVAHTHLSSEGRIFLPVFKVRAHTCPMKEISSEDLRGGGVVTSRTLVELRTHTCPMKEISSEDLRGGGVVTSRT